MIKQFDLSYIRVINQMIANLYNDELSLHSRIVNFLNSLMSIIYFDRATILFYSQDEDGEYYKHSSISLNWDELHDVVQTYDEIYCKVDDTLAIFDQKTPIIFKSSTFFNQEERKNNAYWTEYLIPNNCIYSLEGNLSLKNKKNIRGAFNLYRGREKNDFTNEEVAIMELFQIHLSNVLKYYGETDDKSSVLFMLENYKCVGIATLDENCQVVRNNATYNEIMETPEVRKKISGKAVSLCMSLMPGNNPENRDSVEFKFEDIPYFMEVTKIDAVNTNDSIKYVCLVYNLSHFIQQTLNQAREKYRLSLKEFAVLKAVLNGKSNEEISEEQFISLSSVKKYLASMYGKMGIKNQKQIFEKLKLQ
ncbi:helix-turn-helix transcriptional regulator [Anaerovorax odorimutans]|uniref:Helix-turn-helix transcriptional regulator n=1 Tax=Anaerovorax odorimutans TaxID=109327 RepID=A0ABT1RP81_9FIRM|nr:helix-turn-helix transcriptional regulator [Anaerovorax odorimutans]MCQ4636969.1 helix-turn-helix transcriptional regulator [Anaerovorax odorimutans]